MEEEAFFPIYDDCGYNNLDSTDGETLGMSRFHLRGQVARVKGAAPPAGFGAEPRNLDEIANAERKCEAKDRAAVEARDEIAEAERKCEPEDRVAVEAEDEIASGSRNRLL